MKKRLIKTFLFLVIFSFYASMTINAEQSETSQTAILKATIGKLNIDHPEMDIDKNIGNGDLRFVCVCGYACYSPGVEKKDYYFIKKYGERCLKGTSDVIEGDEHGKLIGQAKKYAEKYNSLLLKRLKKS